MKKEVKRISGGNPKAPREVTRVAISVAFETDMGRRTSGYRATMWVDGFTEQSWAGFQSTEAAVKWAQKAMFAQLRRQVALEIAGFEQCGMSEPHIKSRLAKRYGDDGCRLVYCQQSVEDAETPRTAGYFRMKVDRAMST